MPVIFRKNGKSNHNGCSFCVLIPSSRYCAIREKCLILHLVFKRVRVNAFKRIWIPVFLLTLFVAYQVSISMFSHVHYVNGVMIVHSHPSDDSQHVHTETQVITIAQASSFVGLEPLQTTVAQVYLPVLSILEFARDISFASALHQLSISLRAPPALA